MAGELDLVEQFEQGKAWRDSLDADNDAMTVSLSSVLAVAKSYSRTYDALKIDPSNKAKADARFAAMLVTANTAITGLSVGERTIFDAFITGLGYTKN